MGQDIGVNSLLTPQDLRDLAKAIGPEAVTPQGLADPSKPQASQPQAPVSTPSNPMAAQGVSQQEYQQVQSALANPNAGDGFGLPQAATAATPPVASTAARLSPSAAALSQPAVNPLPSQFPSSTPGAAIPGGIPAAANAGANSEMPPNELLEMFDPKYFLPGAGIGLLTATGLNAAYKDPENRIVKWVSKIPGMTLGGNKNGEAGAIDKRLNGWEDSLAGKGGWRATLADQSRRFRNTLSPEQMNQALYADVIESVDKKFGPKANGVIAQHFDDIKHIDDLSQHLDEVGKAQKAVYKEGFFSSIKRALSGSNGPAKIADIFEVADNGTLSVKTGISPDSASGQKALKRLNKAFGQNYTELKDALDHANRRGALARSKSIQNALKAKGVELTGDQLRRKLKAPASFAKGRLQNYHQYIGEGGTGAGAKQVSDASRKLGPIGRMLVGTGRYIQRTFGGGAAMENVGGEKMGKLLQPLIKFGIPIFIGATTFGLAFKEASDAESPWDKFRAFTREIASGTIAALAGFEFFNKLAGTSGLVSRAFGRLGQKSLIGRFGFAGTAISMGMAMGGSILLVPIVEKGVELILGKPNMKPGKGKEAREQQAEAQAQAQAGMGMAGANNPAMNNLGMSNAAPYANNPFAAAALA
ncbi:MAG: hypothetical protein VKJ04_00380 [Vampirovibrionales bacterium]|nr:hypothetical protein [Vampirovibrionales bacterium]